MLVNKILWLYLWYLSPVSLSLLKNALWMTTPITYTNIKLKTYINCTLVCGICLIIYMKMSWNWKIICTQGLSIFQSVNFSYNLATTTKKHILFPWSAIYMTLKLCKEILKKGLRSVNNIMTNLSSIMTSVRYV